MLSEDTGPNVKSSRTFVESAQTTDQTNNIYNKHIHDG